MCLPCPFLRMQQWYIDNVTVRNIKADLSRGLERLPQIRQSGREPAKKKYPPPPPSKFNVQIAQISMYFWQHPPHYISLTLPRNWQSILGILCSERAGTVPTSDSEAQIKEWCETLLINCSFPAPWRTGMQTAEPTYLRKSLNGHAKRFLVCWSVVPAVPVLQKK